MDENKSEIFLKGRLKGYQRMQMHKLLDMLYTPGELAKEIGFTRRQVYRVYIPAGCPRERDEKRRWWVNGKAFREWYEITYPRMTLREDEAFCLTCKKPVKMANPVKKKKGNFIYLLSECPKCGRKLPKIIKNKKRGI